MTELVREASIRVASLIDRRRFIRRIAGGTFAGVAALAAGRFISPSVAFAYTEYCEPIQGTGCPMGCGSDRCCANFDKSECRCSNGNGGCIHSSCCDGMVGGSDWGGTSCWTCTYVQCIKPCDYRVSTTCCDCRQTCSACAADGICVAYRTTYTVIGACGSNCVQPLGTVTGVATGDPATSWGMQPELAP